MTDYASDVLKSAVRFVETTGLHFSHLLKSLSNEVTSLLKEGKDEESCEIIEFIDFTFQHLFVTQDTVFHKCFQEQCVKEMLAGMFCALSYIEETDISYFKSIEPALEVVSKLIGRLQHLEEERSEEDKKKDSLNSDVNESSERYFKFYCKLSGQVDRFKSENMYKLASSNVVKIQRLTV